MIMPQELAFFFYICEISGLGLAASSQAPVLLLGETGTGKELAAKFIHQHSDRSTAPFLTVDCTVLNEALVESELFGHEKGSFTGSLGVKLGLFELADGGTLFLDEMGELPATLQAKLLRVLESGEFRRVGSHHTLRTDVRVVCATNRHLWEAVKAREFREDLFYRIACLTVHLPSLRDRLQDIPLLAKCLLNAHAQASGRVYRLTDKALGVLRQHSYPGNIRELRNMIYAAVAYSANGQIKSSDIERVLRRSGNPQQPVSEEIGSPVMDDPVPLNGGIKSIGGLEAQHIRAVLRDLGGNRRLAAETLGISTRTLYRKIKLYGLE